MDSLIELGWEEARQEILKDLEMIVESSSAHFADISDVSDQSVHLYKIKKRVVACPLIPWLGNQSACPRVYWKSRDHDWACAGVGVSFFEHAKDQDKADAFWERVASVLDAAPDVKLFFGMSFYKTLSKAEWKGFYAIQALLPRFCVTQENGVCYFTCHVLVGPGEKIPFDHLRRELEAIAFLDGERSLLPSVVGRRNFPCYEEWGKAISHAREALSTGLIQKITLSRRVSLELAGSIDPCALLAGVAIGAEDSGLYFFQFSRECSFLGGSSELLYVRKGQDILSEAVIRTRPRGSSAIEDELIQRELLTSVKDARTQRPAVASLLNVFRETCLSYDPPSEGDVMKLKHQQHLRTRLSGKLQSDMKEQDILSAFHPASSVSGQPLEKVLPLIDQLESFERGWFSAPVGIIGREYAEISLASCACLVEEDQIHLFSGAEVVGVSPGPMWERLETNIQEFLDVFMAS